MNTFSAWLQRFFSDPKNVASVVKAALEIAGDVIDLANSKGSDPKQKLAVIASQDAELAAIRAEREARAKARLATTPDPLE